MNTYNQRPSAQEPRKAQLASRNASSFNPISFNPEAQGHLDDYEKQQKKEKQAAYRDQLDQMKSRTQSQRGNERNITDDYAQRAQREADTERERAEQQKYSQENQDNQRRQEEEAFLQEQYRKMAEYERYQQQMDEMEKNYPKGGNLYKDDIEGYSQPQPQSQSSQPTHEVRQYQHEHVPQANRSPQKSSEDASTFSQQDNIREQLLSKIKGGYNNQNAQVWNTYQKVLESQEKNKREFEQSLVNKAVQDRQREDVRAMSEWDRKKRMQQEAADANRRAAEIKSFDKKKQRVDDAALENQRIHDSLSQFERDNFRQKEIQKRMKEDASRVLEQQVKEAHTRKLDKEQNVTQFSHPSRDQPSYGQDNQRKAQTPLIASYDKINQAQSMNRNVEALDNLSHQMDNKLSMKGSYGQDAYNQGYNQYSQPHSGDYAPQDRYQGYQSKQSYEAPPQQYGGRQQETQSRQDSSNAAEYQKNRFKARNTGYNIITGEFR